MLTRTLTSLSGTSGDEELPNPKAISEVHSHQQVASPSCGRLLPTYSYTLSLQLSVWCTFKVNG